MYSLIFISLYLFEFLNHKLLSNNYSKSATSKLVSSTHAFITGLCDVLYLTNFVELIFLRHVIMISIGYCIYDSYNLYRNKHKDRNVLYLHHIFMIIGIMYCNVNVNYEYYRLLALNYLAEISTILINFTVFLYETKRTHFIIFHISSITLLITFFFTRIITSVICLYHIYYIGSLMLIPQILLTAMNFYWFSAFYQKYMKILYLSKKIKSI